MTLHASNINRRDFLATAAGITLGLTIAPDPVMRTAGADTPLALDVWLTIATDGTITIVSPAAEMGQGTFTTLAGRARRRARRRLVEGAHDPSAGLGRQEARQSAVGSASSTRRRASPPAATSSRCGSPARRRGACCSTRWRRDGACRSASCRPSRAWSCTRPRTAASATARSPPSPARRRELPKIEDKDLKSPARFRYIGKDVPRVDVPRQGHGRGQVRHRRPGARHGLRRGAAFALRGRRAERRWTMPPPGRCRGSPTWCGCRTASASSAARSRLPRRPRASCG